jgi:GNAT superfamily N-acetyltransferase
MLDVQDETERERSMSPVSRSFDVRTLTLDEVRDLIGWASQEGWNPGLADANAFHAADPDGFIGSFEGGALAAAISAVRYSPAFGFIGLFIVRPDRRGHGLGRAVWQAGISRLAGATIGLDGVQEQQANYRRQGFVPAYRTIRYAGEAPVGPLDPQVRPLPAEQAASVAEIDRRCFPAERGAFLADWLKAPHRTFVHADGPRVNGYATLRQCRDGYKIGPLFAGDVDVARGLVHAAAATVPGQRIAIDVPEHNQPAVELVRALDWVPIFETLRMYRGSAPRLSDAEVFGITTLELG